VTELVLSLFPGIGLLDLGFEMEGFTVVRGPDLLWGGDIRRFSPPAGRFDGIIGGPPCQDFSKARRAIPPTGYGLEMLNEFVRVIIQAAPTWWLMENVPTVPNVTVPGYVTQRFDLDALECAGAAQSRLRHFQFGARDVRCVTVERKPKPIRWEKACLASDGRRVDRRNWAEFCELQGLPATFDLPGFTMRGKYEAVGNGVPVYMARTVARAVLAARDSPVSHRRLCICGCGRAVNGKQQSATPACRKRLERRRRDSPVSHTCDSRVAGYAELGHVCDLARSQDE
jgi:DNA (cytosine-5)-methyltransferase 1